MSWGGANAYKKPWILWGGRMRSSLKLPKVNQGVAERLRSMRSCQSSGSFAIR